MTIYYCECCRHCGTLNMVYGGDPDDMTGFDPTGLFCYKCGKGTTFGEDVDEGGFDSGTPTPKEALAMGHERERKRCVDLVSNYIGNGSVSNAGVAHLLEMIRNPN